MITDDDLAGSRVTVMGLGRFGGQIAAVRFLARLGCDILVTDLAGEAALAPSIEQIRPLIDAGQVTLRLGKHNVSDFTTCEYVVVSPAVPHPWDNRYLRAAEAAGIPLTTEIRLTVERLPNRMRTIGVTGTAGKSTTAAMTAHVLRGAHRRFGSSSRVWLGGNIGDSLINDLGRIREDDHVVLELSSFQLHWLGREVGYPKAKAWSPSIACLTNFSENHLDWHVDEDHYRSAKLNIVRALGEGGHAITADEEFWGMLPLSMSAGASCAMPITVNPKQYQERLPNIPGFHNVVNANLAAYTAMCMMQRDIRFDGIEPDELEQFIITFPGLPHRLERITLEPPRDGILIFNDSKSTTPDATRLAVEAFDDTGWPGAENVFLIAGGYDKQSDLTPMVDTAARCARVYTVGTTGASLAEAINHQAATAGDRQRPLSTCAQTLEVAVAQAAADIAGHTGQAVLLLSPGCASWDQFTNYEERGDRFTELCREQFTKSPKES